MNLRAEQCKHDWFGNSYNGYRCLKCGAIDDPRNPLEHNRARELLAAEYDRDQPTWAKVLREGCELGPIDQRAIRAITAALKAAENAS